MLQYESQIIKTKNLIKGILSLHILRKVMAYLNYLYYIPDAEIPTCQSI